MGQVTKDGVWGPVHGSARAFRAALVTLVVVSVSIIAHVAAGGMRPSAFAMTMVALLTGLASVWLSRWRLSAPRLAVLMLLVEASTHVVCTEMAPMPSMSGSISPAMLAGHLVAACLAVLYLRTGEEILWSMLQSWASRVAEALRRPVLPSTPRLLPVTGRSVLRSGRLDPGCSAIRGPPA